MSSEITQSEALSKINALLQEQRIDAYNAARKRIAGNEPVLAYERTQGRFSSQFTSGVQIMIAFMMIVAFLPSAMRIHAVALNAASELFGTGNGSQYVSALCVVLLAEVCQIAFSIAFATATGRFERIGYGIGAAFGTAIALAGNGAASALQIDLRVLNFNDVFKALDTFAPPVITLIAAQVIKSQALHAAELRTRTQTLYAEALTEWNFAFANSSQSSEWNSVLANSLRDAIRNANRRSYAVVRSLTDSDWRALILRERNAEEWWNVTEVQEQLRIEKSQHKTQNGERSTGATGEVINAESKRNGNAFIKVCPQCAREFSSDTERSATNKLVAHMKAHKNERKNAVPDAIVIPEKMILSTNGLST